MADGDREQAKTQRPSAEEIHARYASAKRKRTRVNSFALAILDGVMVLGGRTTVVVCLVGRHVNMFTLYALLAIVLGAIRTTRQVSRRNSYAKIGVFTIEAFHDIPDFFHAFRRTHAAFAIGPGAGHRFGCAERTPADRQQSKLG